MWRVIPCYTVYGGEHSLFASMNANRRNGACASLKRTPSFVVDGAILRGAFERVIKGSRGSV
jgi:hypothetical protein